MSLFFSRFGDGYRSSLKTLFPRQWQTQAVGWRTRTPCPSPAVRSVDITCPFKSDLSPAAKHGGWLIPSLSRPLMANQSHLRLAFGEIMKKSEVFHAWASILTGSSPSLSIEITKECPLRCPGCYAFDPAHLGGATRLTELSDFKGEELVRRVLAVVDEHRPLHVSRVGGETCSGLCSSTTAS